MASARNAVMSHAYRLARAGVVGSGADLAKRFGWNLQAMAHDIQHAFKNGCPYCRQPFVEMANGLADVTLDIIDPSKPPYYATNTRWCCLTCNRAKSKTDPSRWAKKLLWWDEWRRTSVGSERTQSGTLFDGRWIPVVRCQPDHAKSVGTLAVLATPWRMATVQPTRATSLQQRHQRQALRSRALAQGSGAHVLTTCDTIQSATCATTSSLPSSTTSSRIVVCLGSTGTKATGKGCASTVTLSRQRARQSMLARNSDPSGFQLDHRPTHPRPGQRHADTL